MSINYLGRVPLHHFSELRYESRKSLASIYDKRESMSSSSTFRHLFLANGRFWRRYDAYFHLPLGDVTRLGQERRWEVVRLLGQALGERVISVALLTSGTGECVSHIITSAATKDGDEIPTWAVGEAAPAGQSQYIIALKYNNGGEGQVGQSCTSGTDTIERMVDRGPSAEDAAL